MTTQTAIDEAKVEAFVGKALGDVSGTMVTLLAAMGERVGLFKDLAAHGPTTSDGLAARTGTNERYVREWLGGMASAGYLDYDPVSRSFTLPPEHAPVFAQEGGPVFFGGILQELLGALPVIPMVVEAFHRGGGAPQSAYDANFWEGLERFTAGWFENLLLPVWIPAIPGLQARLTQGARVADVGCGAGRALVKLAQAFPASRCVGYDLAPAQLARATAAATAAGVDDRVRFVQRDAVDGFPEPYDVITTFDVIHDAVNPRGLLRAIRQGLKPDGVYLCLEINCSDKLEENAGPLGGIFYGISVLYCLTTSLAAGGEGLGTVGLHEPKLRELAAAAGFGSVRRVPLENPFNTLYELRP